MALCHFFLAKDLLFTINILFINLKKNSSTRFMFAVYLLKRMSRQHKKRYTSWLILFWNKYVLCRSSVWLLHLNLPCTLKSSSCWLAHHQISIRKKNHPPNKCRPSLFSWRFCCWPQLPRVVLELVISSPFYVIFILIICLLFLIYRE